MKHIFKVALAGNPNCGKTTIFNQLTGTHQHVGNYSGVTVERKTGHSRIGEMELEIIDLPGIYSLSSATAEEKVAFAELMNNDIDMILNIIDAGNIQRNLYLTTQLAELRIPMLLVFNMSDEAEERGFKINYSILCHYFNSPGVEAIGSKGIGLDQLREKTAEILSSEEKQIPKPLDYGEPVSTAIRELISEIEKTAISRKVPIRCVAVKMLEKDEEICRNKQLRPLVPLAEKWAKKIETRFGTGCDIYMTDCRYGMIAGACREAISMTEAEPRRQFSEDIDRVVTHKYLGIPIFLIMMFLVFFLTFICAEPFTNLLGMGFDALTNLVNVLWPAGKLDFLHSLVTEGIIGGVGGVLQFLPNILFLFLAISFLEGTGYMARAAFVMDGFMHKFGLHGKSFIPMLLGFGCTVPAIMATRTIESERDRLTTILVLPLMSCGARLPIYSLLIPAFFPQYLQAVIMWLIYLIGIVLALVCAGILKSTLFRGEDEIFVMELPPYRMPAPSSILLYMLERTLMYLKKAGTVILAASVVMFIVNTVPAGKPEKYTDFTSLEEKVKSDNNLSGEEKNKRLEILDRQRQNERLSNSISCWIGKKLSYVFKPLGFDWKVCSALVGAFAGKELFVSQMGILNAAGSDADSSSGLQTRLRKQYSPLQAFCIMLFCLVSMPCVATVAVVRRETDSWKFALGQIAGLTLLAYSLTLIVYQIGIHL